jgi:hypothetical protein
MDINTEKPYLKYFICYDQTNVTAIDVVGVYAHIPHTRRRRSHRRLILFKIGRQYFIFTTIAMNCAIIDLFWRNLLTT